MKADLKTTVVGNMQQEHALSKEGDTFESLINANPVRLSLV